MVVRLQQCEEEPVPERASDQLTKALIVAAKTESTVQAYRHILEDKARTDAAEVDAAKISSPIHGWPFAVKEVFDIAGVPTSGGSAAFHGRVPETDATAVQLLRHAGAVLVGTLISHELTCGLDTPPTRNPYDTDCYPGGSSAGAGVSVAVGSARFALGTDAAGSVRIPAVMTGTTGFKPTFGLISSHGVMRQATAPSIDHVGIIAKTASDVSEVFNVISAPDMQVSATLHHIAEPSSSPIACDGLRLAVLGKKTLSALAEIYPLDREIEAAFLVACDTFRSAGARIEEIEIPALSQAIETIVTFFSAELSCAHADLLTSRRKSYHPGVLNMIEEAFTMSADQLLQAVRTRVAIRQDIASAFDATRAKFLLTPTTPRTAMSLGNFDPSKELGSLITFTCGFNLSGNPAISLPCGQTAGGLPVGLQIVGPQYSDLSVLEISRHFQELTKWHRMRPPLIV